MWLRTVFIGHLKYALCAQSNLVKHIHLRLKLFFVQFMALLFSAQKQVTSVLMSFWLVSSINYQTNAQDKLLHIIIYGIKPHMNRSNRCMLVCFVAQVVWVCGSPGCTLCLMTCGRCWSSRCVCGVRPDSVPRTSTITDITAATQTHGTPRASTYSPPTHSTGERWWEADEIRLRRG